MKISSAGLELLKAHEGYSDKAYLCPAGVWTIAYGHTGGVKPGDTCTQEQAGLWLLEDTEDAATAIARNVKVALTQNQFDALVSFVYNVGGPAFAGSTMLRKLNAGDYTGASNEFARWNKGGGKILNGLVARRSDERDLFVTGIGV